VGSAAGSLIHLRWERLNNRRGDGAEGGAWLASW
jgi:hypothetical protein